MINHIRKAEKRDVATILSIIKDAQNYLKEQGSPQWQNGFGPNRQAIEDDIDKREGYVMVVEGIVCGYAALVEGIDNSYTKITEGEWDNRYEKYISIHRVALSPAIRGRGLSVQFLPKLISAAQDNGHHDIRIDTHPQNIIMKKTISRSGFIYRGIVHFPIPDGEREAYQLIV